MEKVYCMVAKLRQQESKNARNRVQTMTRLRGSIEINVLLRGPKNSSTAR